MRLLGCPFEIMVKSVDETVDLTLPPADVVRTLALRKARAVSDELAGDKEKAVVIGADTIVVWNGVILGKPRDEEEAFRMLSLLQGNTHQVYSGVACMDTATDRAVVDYRMTQVTFKPLTDQQIRRYIQTGEPLDKAGAYGIQGYGALLVDHIEGDYFNVVGLPLSRLTDLLQEFGIEVI